MRFYAGLVVCCVISLGFARENPFSMAMDPLEVGRTTQIKENSVEFNSTKFTLPSSARILKSASIVFQNIDGSISEEIVAIDQNVDWHYPLVLSSHKPEAPKPAEPLPLVSALKNPDLKKASNDTPKPTPPPESLTLPKEVSTKMLFDNIGVSVDQKTITIYTKDMKVRDFLISNPYKVVVDFKKERDTFATKSVEFSKPPFVSATLGDHDGFYRIAIVLDGHYRYDIAPIQGGYTITLK